MKDYEPKINANTGYWIPTIIKVDNGYIIQSQSPQQDIRNNFVVKSIKDLVDFLCIDFEIDKKEFDKMKKELEWKSSWKEYEPK